MINAKNANLNFGKQFAQGHCNDPKAGKTRATQKIELNGFQLKPGQISPRTSRFFRSHWAEIRDHNDSIELIGGIIEAEDLKKFKDEREVEILIDKLNAISSDVLNDNSWKKQNGKDVFWIRISNDCKPKLIHILDQHELDYTCKKVQESTDRCILLKKSALIVLFKQDRPPNIFDNKLSSTGSKD